MNPASENRARAGRGPSAFRGILGLPRTNSRDGLQHRCATGRSDGSTHRRARSLTQPGCSTIRSTQANRTMRPVERTIVRDAATIALAAAMIGVSFGVVAAGKGIPFERIQMMSLTVFAGGSQFVLVGGVGSGIATAVVAGLERCATAPGLIRKLNPPPKAVVNAAFGNPQRRRVGGRPQALPSILCNRRVSAIALSGRRSLGIASVRRRRLARPSRTSIHRS